MNTPDSEPHGAAQASILHETGQVAPGEENLNTLRMIAPSWIEIELVGEDGLPIPQQRYRIEASDGSLQEGNLDDKGVARLETRRGGICRIWFPDLDTEAWETQ